MSDYHHSSVRSIVICNKYSDFTIAVSRGDNNLHNNQLINLLANEY